MLIAFRVLQGLAGGGLQPSSQGVSAGCISHGRSRGRRKRFSASQRCSPRSSARHSADTSPTTTAGAGFSISMSLSGCSRW